MTIKELENKTRDYAFICRYKDCFNDTFSALANSNVACSLCGKEYTYDRMIANGWIPLATKKPKKKKVKEEK